VRCAPLVASLALHVSAVGLAAVVVPRASARVAEIIPVELVAIEPPPRVAEAPSAPAAPAKRLTLPKPIVTPPPKIDERRDPPREPEPAPMPVREPQPAPAPTRATEPVPSSSPGATATASAPTSTSSSGGSTSGPVATGRGPESGVSLIDDTTTRSAAVVASLPPDAGVTRVARPSGGYQVRPSYPSSARRLNVQGTTLLRVHVLADGRVGDIDVEQSAGHPDLDQAATDAVRRWRFEPARRGEQAVAMWVRLPVEFRLK
jgi:periplasmic protein TonB